jgi:hypothetical protein
MSGCRAQEKDVRTESGMLDELRRTPPRHVTLPPPLHASTLEPSGWGALLEDRWERPGSCPVRTGWHPAIAAATSYCCEERKSTSWCTPYDLSPGRAKSIKRFKRFSGTNECIH